MRRRERLAVLARAVGLYTLLRVERGGLEPGAPGQFFMLSPPGRVLPRPMSLCLAPPGELAFLIDPIGPGTHTLCALEAGDELAVFGPLGQGFDLRVERPLLVGGGIGIAPLPYLAQTLGSPPAVLGFRSEAHAEAAVLLGDAEVVVEPALVTELHRARVRRARVRAGADAARRTPALPRRAARLGGPDGVRVRRLLRLRGRDRRRVEAPLRRRPRADQATDCYKAGGGGGVTLLNASGCLDALRAPEVARQLDAFVTKTVTPLPRAGNAPTRIVETEAGMLNSIGLANPGRERFLADALPRLRGLDLPLWVSVGGFSAREYAETCERLERRDDRAQPLLPQRRRGAGVRRGHRRRLPRGDGAPALRQAVPGRLGHRRGRPRGRGRGRRRPLAREHDPRPRARPGQPPARPGHRDRRLLRARRCGRSRSQPCSPAAGRRPCRSSAWAA